MANVSSSNGIEKRPNLRFSEFNSNWTSVKLGLAGDFYGGLSGKSKEDFGHGDAKFITYRNVFANTFASDKLLESVYVNQNERQNRVHMGDVLFTQSSETFEEVGMSSVWLHSTEPFLNSFCMGWRPNSSDLNPVFLGYLLRTPTIRKQIICQGQGISRINLAASRISNIDLYHPSPDEQLKIANILSLLDQRIEAVCKIVEHLKKYKRGLLQAIFSREVQLENLSNWEHRLFSEIASLGKGKYTPKQEEALPCIELEHLEQQTGQIIGYANSNEQNSVKSVFHKGDVLFGKLRPYLRKFALPEYDGVCSSEIWVLHPESNIDSTFLFYLIQSESFIAAANISSGTKMPRAEWSKVSNESFFIPELSEQKRIADLFSAIDKRIVNASRSVNKMQSLKQGLLQQLFI